MDKKIDMEEIPTKLISWNDFKKEIEKNKEKQAMGIDAVTLGLEEDEEVEIEAYQQEPWVLSCSIK